MVLTMSDEAYVRKFAFRPFEGTYQGRIWRVWTVAWFNMTHQWHRSRVFKILIIFTIFILIIPNMFLFIGIDAQLETKTANEILKDHLWDTVRDFTRFQVMITSLDETDPTFDTGFSIIMLIGVVMMGAGLLAQNAKKCGLTVPKYVKTSLSPGSSIVMEYLQSSGLDQDLEALGFYLAGRFCTSMTSCILYRVWLYDLYW